MATTTTAAAKGGMYDMTDGQQATGPRLVAAELAGYRGAKMGRDKLQPKGEHHFPHHETVGSNPGAGCRRLRGACYLYGTVCEADTTSNLDFLKEMQGSFRVR